MATIDAVYGGTSWRKDLNLEGGDGSKLSTDQVNAKLKKLAEDYASRLRRYDIDGEDGDKWGFGGDHPCVYTVPFAFRKGK